MWVRLVFIELLHPALRGRDFVRWGGYQNGGWVLCSYDELEDKDKATTMKEYNNSKKRFAQLTKYFKDKKVWLERETEDFIFVVIDKVQHCKFDKRCFAWRRHIA